MFSNLIKQIGSATPSSCLAVVFAIQKWQAKIESLYDRVFINAATSTSVIGILNDLSTSGVMLEAELSEIVKFYTGLTQLDVTVRFAWVYQDMDRIKTYLESLKAFLIGYSVNNDQVWISQAIAEIERLLE